MIRILSIIGLSLALTIPGMAGGKGTEKSVKFTVRVENISKGEVLMLSTGGSAPFAMAPGLWVVVDKDAKIFTPKMKEDGRGLEPLAEDGDPSKLAASLMGSTGVISAGVFNTPVGAMSPGPITPGGAFEFMVEAKPGSRLVLLEMFGQQQEGQRRRDRERDGERRENRQHVRKRERSKEGARESVEHEHRHEHDDDN